MHEKRFVPLFIAVLLTLLAGSTAQAQGRSYDPRVAARFVGKWQWLKPPNTYWFTAPYIEIEDRSTYALMRTWVCYPLMRECPNNPLIEIDASAFTQGEKLVHRSEKLLYSPEYSNQWWHQYTNEYTILANGHMLQTNTETFSFSANKHVLTFEYARVSGPPPSAPTRAPAQPPVAPVQPVVPGAGQTSGYYEKLGQQVSSCSGVIGEQHTPLWQPIIDIWNRVRRLFSASPVVAADRFREGECTWLVARERPDAREWLPTAGADAYTWDYWATHEDWGAFYGLRVDHEPDAGDIVVWKKECGGPYAANGHVAYVTGVRGNTIIVNEANHITPQYPLGNHQVYYGSEYEIRPYSCMRFIHKPTVFKGAP